MYSTKPVPPATHYSSFFKDSPYFCSLLTTHHSQLHLPFLHQLSHHTRIFHQLSLYDCFGPDSASRTGMQAFTAGGAGGGADVFRGGLGQVVAQAGLQVVLGQRAGAAAIAGERAAKNSCSCSLIRSQGGLPMTTSKPELANGEWRIGAANGEW